MTATAPHRSIADKGQASTAPGEPGVWVFILAEMLVFTALFAAIVWARGNSPEAFAQGQALLSQPLGLFNTVVLIVGSVLVINAISAVNQGLYRRASQWMAAAMICGGVFAAVKAIEYATALGHGMWIHTNPYWMLFFAVTGAHLLHVFVGVTLLGLMRRRVTLGLPGPNDRQYFVSASCYWHMVDLLWLVLFPLFYLVN